MQDIIEQLVKYGYVFLFLYSLSGGTSAILASGIFSATTKMDLNLCVLLAFIANALGTIVPYLLGRFYKKKAFKFFKKFKRQLALLRLQMRKRTALLLITQKFIYGARFLAPLVAGFSKISFIKFLCINSFAAFIWALFFGYAGYYFTNVVLSLLKYFKNYPLVLFGIVSLIILALFIYIKKSSVRGLKKGL